MKKIYAVLKQCRFSFLPFALIAISSAYLLTDNLDPTGFFYSTFSFTFVHIFMASMNNTYDVKYDDVSAIMKTVNPIVTKELTLIEAKIINCLSAMLALFTSLFAGPYWFSLIVIGLLLVIVYDVKPIRLKDKPFGLLIVPFYSSLAFLFACLNTSSKLVFPLENIVIFLFFYLLGVTSIRHVPDYDMDLQMNVKNFTSTFGITATRYLELLVSAFSLIVFIFGIFFNILTIIGLPILLVTTFFKMDILLRHAQVMRLPDTWSRFAQIMIINSLALLISLLPVPMILT